MMFDCTVDELAEQLVRKPNLYTQLVESLTSLQGTDVLEVGLESKLSDTYLLLTEANEKARQSDYFVFAVEDSWGGDMGENQEGFVIYQKVNNNYVEILGLDHNGAPPLDYVISQAKKNNVSILYTMNPEKAGLKDSVTEPEVDPEDDTPRDPDVIRYSLVEPFDAERFEEHDIKIIYLP